MKAYILIVQSWVLSAAGAYVCFLAWMGYGYLTPHPLPLHYVLLLLVFPGSTIWYLALLGINRNVTTPIYILAVPPGLLALLEVVLTFSLWLRG